MCGIAGIVNFNNKVDASILSSMTEALQHRGPDDTGYYVNTMVGFGHKRLSIIDLSASGKQPMQTKNGRWILSYNGEIYNYKELRKELEKLGCIFNSNTDSEVVLNAFAIWGLDACLKFNGMYAFSVWDNHKQELTLVRDRYGIKPLYYSLIGNVFLFASEIKSILKYPDYSTNLDKEALIEYFTFQNFFTKKTLFENVHLLPSASYLVFKKPNTFEIKQYWDYHFMEPEKVKPKTEYLEELNFLFRQAVERQLVSDVPVGAYLSGGMDSGSITMVASNLYKSLQTFTVGCDVRTASGIELSYDERETAEYISYLAQTEHYEMVLKPGDMERIMPSLVWHMEEPRVGQSYPNFYASKLASKFVKVVLAGSGGDELFGGYPWRYYRATINDDFEQYVDKYYNYWQRLIPDNVVKDIFSPLGTAQSVSTRDIFKNVFCLRNETPKRPEDYINCSLYFEAKTFLHGLFVMEDKLSMAYGLETRLPFLDNDLVEFSQKLPVKYKLGNLSKIVKLNENEPGPKTRKFFNKTNDGKLLLREAMRKYIPNEILSKTKQGFSTPDASWFKGESIEFVKRQLFSKNTSIYEFLDRKTIENLVTDHFDGKVNRRLLIWSLLYFELWCQIFLMGNFPNRL